MQTITDNPNINITVSLIIKIFHGIGIRCHINHILQYQILLKIIQLYNVGLFYHGMQI